MDILLRRAKEDDFDLIANLADEIWHQHYVPIIGLEQVKYMLKKMYSLKSLQEQMSLSKHEFMLIYDREHCIGFASYSTGDHKNYFIHKFYLKPDHQGKGLGTRVFEELKLHMGHPESIRLTVNRKNYKSVNFYFKNGFSIEKTEDFDIGEGYFMNDFVMLWRK